MRSIMIRLIPQAKWIGIASLLLVIAACNRHADVPRESFKTVDVTGVDWGKDFHLTDHHGRPASLPISANSAWARAVWPICSSNSPKRARASSPG